MEVFRVDPPKGKRSGHWYSSDHVNHHDKTLPSVTAIVGQDPYIKMRKKEKKLAVNALASTLVSKSEPAFREWTGPRGGKHVDPIDKEVDALVKAALHYPDELWESQAVEGSESHEIVAEMLKKQAKFPESRMLHLFEGEPESLESIPPSFEMYVESIWPFTILGIEQMVAHPFLDYAGTVDFIYEKDGQITLLDWKTGNIGYPEQATQLAGYALAYVHESHPDWIPDEPLPLRGEVVQLKKSGEPGFEIKPVNMKNAVEMFLAAHKLWNANQREVWL